jgi:cytoskeletal protein RodZ
MKLWRIQMVKQGAKKPASTRLKFRVPFKPIETAIILSVVLLGTSGILYQKHEQKIHEQLNIAPTSSQSPKTTQSSSAPSTSTPTQPLQSSTQSQPNTTTSSQSSNDSSTSGCTMETLPPPPTTYEDTDALPQGQTEQVTTGTNGLETICNGKPSVLEGDPPVVWVGTGTSTPATTEPNNNSGLTEAQAAEQCQDSLASGAGGGTSVDAEEYIMDCMHQYGY